MLHQMMLDLVKIFINYLILLIIVLIRVAFVTLIERKILGSAQIRIGPNFVGYWGILQPFSDAIKLFTKESVTLRVSNYFIYYLSPVIRLILIIIIWLLFPIQKGGLIFSLALIFFICIRGAAVYPILRRGWSSNCKYRILGRMRAVAQIVSYEVSLAIILLRIIWLTNSFNLNLIILNQSLNFNLFLFSPLAMIWLVSSLAETNRTPYDFSEGESELVSGFNTEYRAGGFSLIFMAEYGNIIFISALFVILFLSSSLNILTVFKTILFVFWFIWVRATLPRYRYDKLINLAWKAFLPITLFLFIFYLLLGYITFIYLITVKLLNLFFLYFQNICMLILSNYM